MTEREKDVGIMISFSKAKELKLKPERVRALIKEIEQQDNTEEIRRLKYANRDRHLSGSKPG